VVILLMVIGGYSINGCWGLFNQWLLGAILLMVIGRYYIGGY
jgi:ribose/xylose/arabinose/galactoside ABC-type transport system permease subunit